MENEGVGSADERCAVPAHLGLPLPPYRPKPHHPPEFRAFNFGAFAAAAARAGYPPHTRALPHQSELMGGDRGVWGVLGEAELEGWGLPIFSRQSRHLI